MSGWLWVVLWLVLLLLAILLATHWARLRRWLSAQPAGSWADTLLTAVHELEAQLGVNPAASSIEPRSVVSPFAKQRLTAASRVGRDRPINQSISYGASSSSVHHSKPGSLSAGNFVKADNVRGNREVVAYAAVVESRSPLRKLDQMQGMSTLERYMDSPSKQARAAARERLVLWGLWREKAQAVMDHSEFSVGPLRWLLSKNRY